MMLWHSTFITDSAAATQGCDKTLRLNVVRSIPQYQTTADFARVKRD